MTQFLSGDSNPNYYDGSFTYGPLTNYNKIQQFVNANLQNAFTPDLGTDHITSDPATWSAIEQVYAGYVMDSITLGKWRFAGGLRIEGTTPAIAQTKLPSAVVLM